MRVMSTQQLQAADTNDAVEIAERVWWVGHHLAGDPFQCHTYLIEHGDQSVLLDPGSRLTFRHTLRKIEQVLPFSRIRYFVCHHQDPDITGALSLVEELISRDDACIVSHWRAQALLKHYDLRLPFWLVEEHDWLLDLGGRQLQFVFTPYMHFPGAFCSFDRRTGVLFSSDIFGGFTEDWSLVARGEGYFENLRPFHEHYIPGRDVLLHGLSRLEQLPLALIAPQHGSLIPQELIPFIIDKLKSLECGLYLMAKEDTHVLRLSRLNRMLRQVLDSLILYRDFKEVAQALLVLVRDLLPARGLEFYAQWHDQGQVLHLGPHNRFRGQLVEAPVICREMLGCDRPQLQQFCPAGHTLRELPTAAGPEPMLVLPLFQPDQQRVNALALIRLKERAAIPPDTEQILEQISIPLEVAVERERIYRTMEMERQEIYERAVRDHLTGLYTRYYMHESLRRFMELHDRDADAAIGLVLLDLDHFKQINDTYGHSVGDQVLREVARVIKEQLRGSDIGVRLGGEEIAVFLIGRSAPYAPAVAERARHEVSQLRFEAPMADRTVTVSAGVAQRQQGEPLESLISRADAALYHAKRHGRNRVISEELPALRL